MHAGDLIQWASLASKTGSLEVRYAGVEKKVYFREGRLIASASTDPRDYLGQFLMSYGYVNEEELSKAMQVQRESGMLLGKILVTIGVITEENLMRLMRTKAEEEIYDIFLWDEGEFTFTDDELPRMQMIPLNVDVTGLIMEGSKRKDEWELINEVIPDRNHVPVLEREVEVSDLPPEKRRIVEFIDGKRSIEEIGLESRAVKFLVAKTIYEQVKAGTVKVMAPSGDEALTSEDFASTEKEVEKLLSMSQKEVDEGKLQTGLQLLRAAQEIEPNHPKVKDALGRTEDEIRKRLEEEGITIEKVPTVVKEIGEISNMNFRPNEGFVLSRIDGSWDIGSIIKISPLRE
ncbi:MAG: DUF4388 domain-containing protein, partial [Thermoanaerobaculia bacterium]|nr:DUF4388 domain-containing protein [Thermoanaerobaculia bacterium]